MLRRQSLALGGLLGVVTSLPLIALLYLGQQLWDFPFFPFDLFEWLARLVPGGLVTFLIDSMVRVILGLHLGAISDTAKAMEQLFAIVLSLIGAALFGVAIVWVLRQTRWSGRRAGAVGGTILFLVVLAVEMANGLLTVPGPAVFWLAALIVGWGTLLGLWLDVRPSGATRRETDEQRINRRAFLAKAAGGALFLAATAFGLGRFFEQRRMATGANQPLPNPVALETPSAATSVATPSPGLAGAPAPGTRPLVTTNEDFYRIDIDLAPEVINGAGWTLDVKGLFDHPRPLKLADLMAYPAVSQPITLSCISNPVGGDLIGNANWTGLRLRDLLNDLGLQRSATALYVESSDGFYESVVMRDLLDERTLMVYGMNGKSLPVEHGFPLRILIPNRYGMKQPKWITRISAVATEKLGYWVERGWSKEARPQIVSVIDKVAHEGALGDRVPLGGIAWAGDRGVAKVEIQVDAAPWMAADLLPALGTLTWVQWRYDWPRASGVHTFRVRATDGAGALQIERQADVQPDGATGYHAVTVRVA